MEYLANMVKANSLKGTLVGNGQCVTFVHAVAIIPATIAWRRGEKVKDAKFLIPGTVIATFDDNGHYGNHMNGTSHAAIYLGKTAAGIEVLDQWNGHTSQPVHQRTIRFKSGHGQKVDDGDQFYVVQ